jgi:hypothetical protein
MFQREDAQGKVHAEAMSLLERLQTNRDYQPKAARFYDSRFRSYLVMNSNCWLTDTAPPPFAVRSFHA